MKPIQNKFLQIIIYFNLMKSFYISLASERSRETAVFHRASA
jgi:hypothetical protein